MFWEIFLGLCEKHNIKPNPLAKQLGISSGAVTSWKNGKIPHPSTLIKIANYFGVTTAYLLGEESGASATVKNAFVELPSLSGDEQKIILTYRTNETFREAVNNIYRLTTQGTEPKETIRVYRAARSADHHDAEIVEMDAARLAALDKLPDTDEL